MEPGQIVVAVILVNSASGAFAAYVASEKDYSGFGWFFAGLFFGPLGLLAAAGLPYKQPVAVNGTAPREAAGAGAPASTAAPAAARAPQRPRMRESKRRPRGGGPMVSRD